VAALDTNVVVRLIVGDDLAQANIAQALVAAEACTVAPSVLMECEWVLRSAYGFDVRNIHAALDAFLSLNNINASDPATTQRALSAYEKGLDFGDALHAAQLDEGETLATFDRLFAKRASKAGVHRVKLLTKRK
jgi:predicted nucleic-acid-binding protein